MTTTAHSRTSLMYMTVSKNLSENKTLDLFENLKKLDSCLETSTRTGRCPAFGQQPRQQGVLDPDVLRDGVQQSLGNVQGEGVGRKDPLKSISFFLAIVPKNTFQKLKKVKVLKYWK